MDKNILRKYSDLEYIKYSTVFPLFWSQASIAPTLEADKLDILGTQVRYVTSEFYSTDCFKRKYQLVLGENNLIENKHITRRSPTTI